MSMLKEFFRKPKPPTVLEGSTAERGFQKAAGHKVGHELVPENQNSSQSPTGAEGNKKYPTSKFKEHLEENGSAVSMWWKDRELVFGGGFLLFRSEPVGNKM